MASPSPGCAPVRRPASTTSALDIPQSGVRRRVSSSHLLAGREGYRIQEAHGEAAQQKLPTLGSELFSNDGGSRMRAPPPATLVPDHLVPPELGLPSAKGDPFSRLPTPNFAAAPQSTGRLNDADMFGLLSKPTQPFRKLKAQPKLEGGTTGPIDGSVCGTLVLGTLIDSRGACYNQSRDPNLAPSPATLRQDTAPSDRTFNPAPTVFLSKAGIKLVSAHSDTKGKDHGSDFDEGHEALGAEPPDSPTFLATIHRATDRFTRRFPVSISYRKADREGGKEDDQDILPLLGYGETGAVVEWPNSWTPEKWSLLFSVCSVFLYGLTGLVSVLLTWLGAWHNSIITRIIDYDILVTITSASLIVLGTSIFGICGTLLNSRPLLAIYCILLWPSLVGMLVIGYSAYRHAEFALPNKLDQAWSQRWGDEDRMILQYSLHCCGYWSPEREAVLSPLCYPRALLPGCKLRLLHFERANLKRYYTWVFSLVPLHILNMVTAILCSNHVNRLFGKGLTPGKYRLSIADVRANALSVLKACRDTMIPPLPDRVYALRSRQLNDGTSRSPRIPQGDEEWSGRMPYEESIGSMFGFHGKVKSGKERRD